jgi:hypothetical protein
VLADLKLEGAALSSADRLHELRLAAFAERADCELRRGRHAQLVPELEQLTTEHPLHEHFWAQLMLALYRSGRQSEALQAYHEARRVLVDEVGLSPGAELRQLERAILAHDPALGLDGLVQTPPRAAPRPPSPRQWQRLTATTLLIVALAAGAAAAAVVLTRGSGVHPLTRIAPNAIGVLDPSRDALVGQIRLATRPAALAVSEGSLWVAMEDDETLLRLDPETHQVTRTIGLGATPTAIAAAGDYVWVLCRPDKRVVQLDAGTGTVVRTLALNGKITLPLAGFSRHITASTIAATPHAAWLAAGPGLVTRIDAATGSLEHIGTGSASTVAVGDGAVWTVSSPPNVSGAGTSSRIDLQTRHVTEEVPPPNVERADATFPVAADAAGVWVVDENGTATWKIDPGVGEVSAVIPIRNGPIAIASGDRAVWTANSDGTVSRIDPNTAALAKTIPLGRYPRVAYPIALAVGEGAVWVAVR